MLGTLGEHGFITHLIEAISNLIGVEQVGVPNALGLHTQHLLDEVSVFLELVLKLLCVVLGSKRVGIRCSEELHALAVCQLLEHIYHLRRKLLEELHHRARYRERAVELAFRLLHHRLQRLAQRHIRGVDQTGDVLLGHQVIVVVVVLPNLEEAVAFQAIGCMHLKAKTDIFHDCELF